MNLSPVSLLRLLFQSIAIFFTDPSLNLNLTRIFSCKPPSPIFDTFSVLKFIVLSAWTTYFPNHTRPSWNSAALFSSTLCILDNISTSPIVGVDSSNRMCIKFFENTNDSLSSVIDANFSNVL